MGLSKNTPEKSLVERIRLAQRSTLANKRCADCSEMGPTYICLDFWTFVCQTCSGLHRGFGHKIKGISLSEWTPSEVEEIERGGNELAAQCWLASWRPGEGDCEEPDSSQPESLREFMRKKYVEKKWWKPLQVVPPRQCTDAKAAPIAAVGSAAKAKPVPSQGQVKSLACDLLSGDLDVAVSQTTAAAFNPNTDTSAGDRKLVAAEPLPESTFESVGLTSPTQWTADFEDDSSKKAAQKSSEPVGLLDMDLLAPTANDRSDGCLDGMHLNSDALVSNSPTASSSEANTGDRLREALLSGSGSELTRLLESAAAPPEIKEASVEERFEALQGNLQNLFNPFNDSPGSVPGQPLQPSSAVSTASVMQCNVSTMPNGTVGMITPGRPAPQSAHQLSGVSRQQLVQMQDMIVQALQEQEQAPQGGSLETFLDDIPSNDPPKEREFGDLLAMFNEKHPISGLS